MTGGASKGTVKAYNTDGVRLGYEFVQKSYDWAINRLDAADHRLQVMLTLAISVILVGPVLRQTIAGTVAGPNEWFKIAIAFFLGAMVIGLWARHHGELRIVTPRRLYRENWRTADAIVFRNEMMRHAADDCEANLAFVNTKSDLERVVVALIALETASLACWIGGLNPPF